MRVRNISKKSKRTLRLYDNTQETYRKIVVHNLEHNRGINTNRVTCVVVFIYDDAVVLTLACRV